MDKRQTRRFSQVFKLNRHRAVRHGVCLPLPGELKAFVRDDLFVFSDGNVVAFLGNHVDAKSPSHLHVSGHAPASDVFGAKPLRQFYWICPSVVHEFARRFDDARYGEV